jgi:hypothetical protein
MLKDVLRFARWAKLPKRFGGNMQDLLVALTFIAIVILPALVAAHDGGYEELEPQPVHTHRHV